MSTRDESRALLQELLKEAQDDGEWPAVSRFRVDHEPQRGILDELVQSGLVTNQGNRYVVSARALGRMAGTLADRELAALRELVERLQDAYRSAPDNPQWSVQSLLPESAGQRQKRRGASGC